MRIHIAHRHTPARGGSGPTGNLGTRHTRDTTTVMSSNLPPLYTRPSFWALVANGLAYCVSRARTCDAREIACKQV